MYTKASELQQALNLTDAEVQAIDKVADTYPMKIPEYYLKLIDPSDPLDPIRKMCVPELEGLSTKGSLDTSGESHNTKLPGLQHKYRQTALILSTNDCFMYCRHCFRRRLVGLPNDEVTKQLTEAVKYIEEHTEINNVLISGGDAMMNSNDRIFEYLERLTPIEHLDYIRFGTRAPVTFPMRISEDAELLEGLRRYNEKKQLMVVTQFNHPREITPEAKKAVHELRVRGLTVCNQTVLLKGVNDDAQVLGELLKRLVSIGCRPYYVFQCRPVTGVENRFQLPLREGVKIVESAKALQSGMGKSFKYCMSHPTGKIEILGEAEDGRMLFKYHEAKDQSNCGKLMTLELPRDAGWLPESF